MRSPSRTFSGAVLALGCASLAACGRHGFTPDGAALGGADTGPSIDATARDAFSSLDAVGPDAFGADARSVDAGLDATISLDAPGAPDAYAPSDSGLDILCTGRYGSANPFTIPATCSAVFAASSYCGTIQGGVVRYVDLDTGAVCDGPTIRDASLFGLSSLGWAGDAMYACNGTRVVRISLRDGSVIDIGTPCGAVTTDDTGNLLVLPPLGGSGVIAYASEGDAMSGRPSATYVLPSRALLGAHGSAAVLSYNSTDRVAVTDLSAPSPVLTDLLLGGYDDWLHGLDVLASGEIAVAEIDRALGADVVAIFDVGAGVRRAVRPSLSGDLGGLACFSGAPPAPLPTGLYTHETGAPPSGVCSDVAAYASTMDNRHPRSSVTTAVCGMGEPSSYLGFCDLLSPSDPEELHVIGVYQGPGGSGARAPIDVTVHARPRPVVLALSSYEPVEWRLTLEAGASVSRVLVSDYPDAIASTVTGLPASVTPEAIDACDYGFGWEPIHNTGGSDIRRTIAAIRGLTGLAETSFQGCYEGSRFEVPY